MKRHDRDIAFEDSLSDDWQRDLDVAEVSIGNRPMLYLGIAVAVMVAAIGARVIFLGSEGRVLRRFALNGMSLRRTKRRPRVALSMTAKGMFLRTTKPRFQPSLTFRHFSETRTRNRARSPRSRTFSVFLRDATWSLIAAAQKNDFASPVVLADGLSQSEIVNLQALDLPTIKLQSDFERTYPNGPVFSAIVGYTGSVTTSDLSKIPA